MNKSLDTRTKLLTQSPFSLMLELSIPAILGMVVVGLYNMMDSIFVGQMVGDVQMGAIAVSYPFTLINGGSAAMLGVGSASVLSRAIGKKDEATVKKIMGNLVAMVMENKRLQKLSAAALVISVLPLATFVPILFNMTLTDGVRSVWAGVNILSVFVGLILSIICVKSRDSRNVVNIVSTIISSFWVLLMGGIVVLALFISFVQ